MLILKLDVPFATWRKNLSNKMGESYIIPPISTANGFLHSLLGKEFYQYSDNVRINKIKQHYKNLKLTTGVRDLSKRKSYLLKTLFKFKDSKITIGNGPNKMPEYQEVLYNNQVAIIVDHPQMEDDLIRAINNPSSITRSSVLYLGESGNLINSIDIVQPEEIVGWHLFSHEETGDVDLSMSTWADMYYSKDTKYVNGVIKKITSINDVVLSEVPDVSC
jgi:CRISPR-associated protein Cas5/DevS